MAAHSERLIRPLISITIALAVALWASAAVPPVRASVAAPAQASPARARAPSRIVSLVPAVTEMLFAIDAGAQLVAVSSYDDFPPEVASLPRVGALLDPDVERILSLRPDLVMTYGSQSDLQRQLGRAGIPVFSYRHGGLPGMLNTIREVGAATGRPQAASDLIARLERQFDAVRTRVKGRRPPRTLLVFERDGGTLRGMYVSGGRGFLDDMLRVAGGANVFAAVDRESVQPSHETLLSRRPDVIIEVRATGLLAAADVGRAREAWATLASIPAVRDNRIHVLSGDYLVVPGPRAGTATEAYARALHPEVFR